MIWLIIIIACICQAFLLKNLSDHYANEAAKKAADELERRRLEQDNQKKE